MEIKQLKLNGENIYPKVAIDSIVGEDGSSKVDTTVTENSDNLITSGAVYEAIQSGTGHSVAWENVTGKPEFANVATSGDYNDLIDKPYLSTVATSGSYNDLNNKPDLSIYAQSVNLASVATTGNYNDLTNKPSIPAAQVQSDWTQSDTTAIDYIKHKPFNDIRNFVTDDGNHPSLKGDATDYISFTGANGISTSHPAEDYIVIDGSALQPTLVSGTNIKTINGNSLLGSGNIDIQSGGSGSVNSVSYSNNAGDFAPDANGKVTLTIDQILDTDSGRPVTNAAISTKFNSVVDKVAYSNNAGEFTPTNGKVTLTIDLTLDEDSGRPVTNAAIKTKFNSVEETMNGIGTLANANANDLTNVHTDINAINNLITSLSGGIASIVDDVDTAVNGVAVNTVNNTKKLQYTTIGGLGSTDIATIDTTPTSNSDNLITSGGVYSALSGKQATLVSGTNIKTINNQSILGSGNITISGSGSTGRQVISYISSDSTIDQPPLYSLEIPFTDNSFTIKVTAIDCSSTGDRLTSTTNVYTVFAKRYDGFAMRIINRDGDNKDVIKTAISLANSTVTYEGSYGTGNNKWYLPISITSSLGLKAVMIEIIGATVNGASATIYDYPGSLTYPNTSWKNDELNNLMA